jgi:hypothetical protein
MNLLEFCKQTSQRLNGINDSSFATVYIEAKHFYFHNFSGRQITSNSHGIEFFDNVIKFWGDPDSYYTPRDKKDKPIDPEKTPIAYDDYEYNFIRILKLNKEASSEVVKFLSENDVTSYKSEMLPGNIRRWNIVMRDKQKITFEHPNDNTI